MATAFHDNVDVSWVEQTAELDDLQTGAIRRIINLSQQLKGDWSGMMWGDMVIGESFGAIRFQLAYMTYALGLAHVHRLPAAPGLFKQPFDDLITKMRHPDVWHYWSNTSTGMGLFNSDLGELPRQWDPVAKDNIMYSAYLQSMALMYHYLFRDAKYAEPGSLRLRFESMLFHAGGYTFDYDEKSLNQLIYWQMAENGFLGVACEPNQIFQTCNQPNMIGFRLHDLIYGGNLASDAEKGYLAAWNEFGLIDPDSGNFRNFVFEKANVPAPVHIASLNYWTMSLMHSWNADFVKQEYARLISGDLRDGPNGTKFVALAAPMPRQEGEEQQMEALGFGWAAVAATEVGDVETANAVLAYADLKMGPAWQDGGYYYKRRDANMDKDGHFVGMDPITGNVLLHYARLNVKDGLNKLYNEPLSDAHFTQPALIDLPPDVDVRRAIYDADRRALAVTLGAPSDARRIELGFRMPTGGALPAMVIDGNAYDGPVEQTDEGFTIAISHRDRCTLVFLW